MPHGNLDDPQVGLLCHRNELGVEAEAGPVDRSLRNASRLMSLNAQLMSRRDTPSNCRTAKLYPRDSGRRTPGSAREVRIAHHEVGHGCPLQQQANVVRDVLAIRVGEEQEREGACANPFLIAAPYPRFRSWVMTRSRG